MKKPLRYMLSVMLMLALMLSMGTAAFADKTDSELPVEYVTYGVGLPDVPGVDRHELGDDDITIDGVSWRTKTSEDKLYVYVLDLAAAKLLRSCADEAKELGLDYAKLYIENGLIQVREDVPSAEAEELRARLDELTRAAVIGLVAGDRFNVGNGGDVKLQVVVTGFVTGGGEAAEPGTEENGLDVKGVGVEVGNSADYGNFTGKKFGGVTTTTIYIMYGGTTWYDCSGSGGEVKPSCYDSESTPPPQEISSVTRRDGFVGIAKAEGDENQYWIKVIGIGEEKFVPVKDLSTFDDNEDWYNWIADIVDLDSGELAEKIIIGSKENDSDDMNVVMEINLKDDTATPEEIYEEDGSLKQEVPNYDKPNSNGEYEPENGKDIDINETGENSADVALRNTVVDGEPKKPEKPDHW